jgi:hypothetical protein
MRRAAHGLRLIILLGTTALLAACGGSSGPTAPTTSPTRPGQFTIGGSTSGLTAGASLVLLDNAADALTVNSQRIVCVFRGDGQRCKLCGHRRYAAHRGELQGAGWNRRGVGDECHERSGKLLTDEL